MFSIKLLKLLPLIGVISIISGPAHGQLIYDDFNDNFTNPALWASSISGIGNITVSEINQHVEIVLPADAANGPDTVFGGSYASKVSFAGDLDVSIKFQLTEWPDSSGVRIGLGFTSVADPSKFWTVERVYAGTGESFGDAYLTDFNHSISDIVSAAGTTEGQFRIVRVGSEVTAYYLGGDQWHELRRATITEAPLIFGFSAWSHDQFFTGQRVKVSFDDVHVVPLPPSIALFVSGILILLKFRHRASLAEL